ncbi:MAG: CatB-related O-acetyltransferase [Lachnospiraceae bacterium]|nr:CatB-related O-acetyltransferase [Lachnospiraceae bacterium]
MHPAFTDPTPVFGFSYAREHIFDEKKGEIRIGNDVWIGNHVRIMDGVTIGNGAVVGTGAVVTKDLPPYSISVGVPAKVIKYRFDENTIEQLEKTKWWDKGEDWIKSHGADFADVKDLLEALK